MNLDFDTYVAIANLIYDDELDGEEIARIVGCTVEDVMYVGDAELNVF